jgi:hypothetical protein
MEKRIAVPNVLTLAFCAALLAAAEPAPPDRVLLKGSSLGAVDFNHKAHTAGGWQCQVCHHGSKSDKPSKEPQYEACRTCHPMKGKVAFHTVGAKTGVCIDCHQAEKKGPAKCSDCHVKGGGS